LRTTQFGNEHLIPCEIHNSAAKTLLLQTTQFSSEIDSLLTHNSAAKTHSLQKTQFDSETDSLLTQFGGENSFDADNTIRQ
jgi:hypothetical protein